MDKIISIKYFNRIFRNKKLIIERKILEMNMPLTKKFIFFQMHFNLT